LKPKTEALTQTRRAETEIQRLNSQLEAANQDLNAFRYSVSHDLRAPLRHIVGYADILQSTATRTLDQTGQRHLQAIAEAARQMGQMFDALSDLFRLGAAQIHLQRVSLTELVKDAQRELLHEIKGRTIDWHVGDLPEVWGDPAMLEEVIDQLLSNAVKFTRVRNKARIEIGAKQDRNETIYFVRDNGIGFDVDCAGRLFGMFQRLHPASEYEGVGAGLAKVRLLVKQHGGRTWAEARSGKGATFYFSIPNQPEDAV